MIKLYSPDFWREKVVEPEKRNHDGLKWVVHRFPIKGGISIREMIIREAKQSPWVGNVCRVRVSL